MTFIHTAIKIPLTMPKNPVVVRYREANGAVTYEVMDRSAVGNYGTVREGEVCKGEILERTDEARGKRTGTIFAFGEK